MFALSAMNSFNWFSSCCFSASVSCTCLTAFCASSAENVEASGVTVPFTFGSSIVNFVFQLHSSEKKPYLLTEKHTISFLSTDYSSKKILEWSLNCLKKQFPCYDVTNNTKISRTVKCSNTIQLLFKKVKMVVVLQLLSFNSNSRVTTAS